MVADRHDAAMEGTVRNSSNIAIEPISLRVARVRLGLRQRDVAKIIDVAAQRISDFEIGIRVPTEGQLKQLIQEFGESILVEARN